MAHLIEQMAYVGQTPWHDLGNALPPNQPIEVWAREAGMDWTICSSPVRYQTDEAGSSDSILSFEEQRVCPTPRLAWPSCPAYASRTWRQQPADSSCS